MTVIKTLYLLLRIRHTVQNWFITKDTFTPKGKSADGLIRYWGPSGQLNCPLQAINSDLTVFTSSERRIIWAADNSKSFWRRPLLWATRLRGE